MGSGCVSCRRCRTSSAAAFESPSGRWNVGAARKFIAIVGTGHDVPHPRCGRLGLPSSSAAAIATSVRRVFTIILNLPADLFPLLPRRSVAWVERCGLGNSAISTGWSPTYRSADPVGGDLILSLRWPPCCCSFATSATRAGVVYPV
jgi:hypothetical protein